MDILWDLVVNIEHNLLKPLLLFFALGFFIPLLKIPFEFPKPLYQSISLYLLISVGWHGGEELSKLGADQLAEAGGFMVLGFVTNLTIGWLAYLALRRFTKLRAIDAAVVGGYYGSDSAGTFATAFGVVTAAHIAYAAYMPAMLAIMEIPGCLIALALVSKLRAKQMDVNGNLPGEPDYDPENLQPATARSLFDKELLHEVFLAPSLYLLFGGLVIGFVSAKSGANLVDEDLFFVKIFHAVLCLFLLEMGMTAAARLPDLKAAGKGFIALGLVMPLAFASIGLLVVHGYSMLIGHQFAVGTYLLFSVLTGAASYIAVPAIQRAAVPESSPALPLAASLGLTFTFNVTVGIPIYQAMAETLLASFPVTEGAGVFAMLM